MKQIRILLVIFSFIGCTKEKDQSIVGSWTVVRIDAGTGSGFNTSTFQPDSEFSIQFKPDGSFALFGPNPMHCSLRDLNRYQLLNANKVRFYNDTIPQYDLNALFQINNGLSLRYEVRCGYEEKFVLH